MTTATALIAPFTVRGGEEERPFGNQRCQVCNSVNLAKCVFMKTQCVFVKTHTTVRANGEGDITKLDATSLFFTLLKDQQTLFAYEVHPRTVVHNVFSKVFSYFPLIYVPLENISARPPIYVLFSK